MNLLFLIKMNDNKKNFVLFSTIFFAIAVSVLSYNLFNPLFWLKIKIMINPKLVQKNNLPIQAPVLPEPTQAYFRSQLPDKTGINYISVETNTKNKNTIINIKKGMRYLVKEYTLNNGSKIRAIVPVAY